MDGERLTAYYGVPGKVVAVDRPAVRRDAPGKRHGNGREASKPFLHDGIEERELVEARLRVIRDGVRTEFALELLLEVERSRLRQFPHQEAQPVARRVDAGDHVVHELGCYVELVELTAGGGLFLHAAEERER